MINVGIYRPVDLPESFNVCIDNLVKCSDSSQITFNQSIDPEELSKSDVVWDPRAGGGGTPPEFLTQLGRPLVVTLHGVGPLVYPRHYSFGLIHYYRILKSNYGKKIRWKHLGDKCTKIVTVSEFSKNTIVDYLGIPSHKIEVIYNGVDASIFNSNTKKKLYESPYFLHISNDESRKNVGRIIKAYQGIKKKDKWPLVLKLSGGRECTDPNIHIISRRLSVLEIANLYAGAGGFIFPSFYEGFGIPIIEAMASRCPVITTRNTACEEVAGGFCRLVEATDTCGLRHEMERLMSVVCPDHQLDSAAHHAFSFNWERSAQKYYSVFKNAITSPL